MQAFTPTRQPPTLAGTALLGVRASNLIELGDAVQSGFKPVTLQLFAKHLGLTLGETLSLVQLSESTFHSYRRNKRSMGADTSAHLYLLAKVTEASEQYFESVSKAHAWLQTPRVTFGGKTPLQFALLPSGAEYVTTVLSRLEYGVYT